MLLLKTVNVTNKTNVLVQVPKAIASANWALDDGDKLEVLFDEQSQQLVIKPGKRIRGQTNRGCAEIS